MVEPAFAEDFHEGSEATGSALLRKPGEIRSIRLDGPTLQARQGSAVHYRLIVAWINPKQSQQKRLTI